MSDVQDHDETQAAERQAQEVRFFERMKQLETERRSLAEDMKALSDEAAENGFDAAAIKLAVKRSMESDEQRTKRERLEQAAEQLLLNI
jgi:uncharacterized protein (UPF0335 family)